METIFKEAGNLMLPPPISPERTSYLINQRGIAPEVAAIDLEMVKMKMKQEDEMGWSEPQCDSAEIEYKRYLHLCLRYGKGIVPNKIMDEMWHYHILDTRAYIKDCDKVFGHYLHHFPYFGLRGKEDEQNLIDTFSKTKDLYEKEFGESISRDEHTDCWNDCQGRCWHECSSK